MSIVLLTYIEDVSIEVDIYVWYHLDQMRFCKILSLIVSRSSDSVVSYAIWRAVTNGSCELCYTREETKMWA